MEKSSSILKKFERYVLMNKGKKAKGGRGVFKKSHSWTSDTPKAPTGCFSVYVGPNKQRFVIKAEYANHPLFKQLLEDAESEYGFDSGGPLQIPCEVDLFCRVLAEMDSGKEFDERAIGCGYPSCTPFSPRPRFGKGDMVGGYNSYALLTPPRLLKINDQF